MNIDEPRTVIEIRTAKGGSALWLARGPFQNDSGLCWVCDAAEWESTGDTSAEPLRSPVAEA